MHVRYRFAKAKPVVIDTGFGAKEIPSAYVSLKAMNDPDYTYTKVNATILSLVEVVIIWNMNGHDYI